MYKFVTLKEYNANFKQTHPNARVNIEKGEVVLSCSAHSTSCNCVTHEQAIKHINDNWTQTEV